VVRQPGQVVIPLAVGDGGGDGTDSSGDTIDVGFPQPGGAVGAAGGHGVPVGAERHRVTALVWPVRVFRGWGWWGSLMSHSRAVPSTLVVARVCPSRLNATE
jgi:hypothetical protein